MSEQRPFQRLSDRLAGQPLDQTLHEGVPSWLRTPLQEWVLRSVRNDATLARRVLMNLRMEAHSYSHGSNYIKTAVNQTGQSLLEVVDAICQLHPLWEEPTPLDQHEFTEAIDLFKALGICLSDAGSYLRFDAEQHCLLRRVDTSAQQAFDEVRAAAPADAAKHLSTAWVHAYGLHPDPDKSYGESVRAVEAVLNPLVLPNDQLRTLGKSLGQLKSEMRSGNGKWELVVGDATDEPKNIERFIGLVDLLWTNHHSRHAGGPNARAQQQHEAEAVLHLAILLVQWVNTSVLKRV